MGLFYSKKSLFYIGYDDFLFLGMRRNNLDITKDSFLGNILSLICEASVDESGSNN